jgi:hypothetical protein
MNSEKLFPGTRLPAQFVGKPAAYLKARKDKTGFWALPFVAGVRGKSAAPYWGVPASGGYFGGYETGEAMAKCFLKYLRVHGNRRDPSHYLAAIVGDFMVRFVQEGGGAERPMVREDLDGGYDSFRGQYVGFCNTLASWLIAAAQDLGAGLDAIPEGDLLCRANAGLGFDMAGYMGALSKAEEGRAA